MEGEARNVTVVVQEEVERVAPTSLRLNPTYIQVRDGLQRGLNPKEGGAHLLQAQPHLHPGKGRSSERA